MSTYLISYPAEPFDEQNPQPGNVIYSQTYNDGVEDRLLYLSAEDMSVDFPTDARAIGYWANGGEAQGAVHPDYDIIRPFGNDDGVASDKLDFHHFQGHAQRDVQDVPVVNTLAEYYDNNQPIVLTMDRWMDDTPGWEGNGWKATIEFSDPTRPPDARAIGIYDENWNYLYTTGAFVYTEVGTDPDTGDPIMKWQTHNPVGYATPEKEPIYYALLLGSAQEGRFDMQPETDSVVRLFWEGDQVIPSGLSWVDSGATTTGMAGTVTLVSDVSPFVIGSQVRIDGAEMTVTSIWNTQGLVLDPYQASAAGLLIEVWQ